MTSLDPGDNVTITVVGRVNDTAVTGMVSNVAQMTYTDASQTHNQTSNRADLQISIPATPVPTTPAPSPTPVTPTPTTPPPPATTGNVDITTIYYNGAGSSEPDEYVEIKNKDSNSIQLQNWKLSDAANHVFTFPSFVMTPGQTCRVYTNENHPEWCGFSYGSGSAIWNNTGDTATLRDSNGTVVDTYSY